MADWIGKRYWIVGASEGLGEGVAHALSKRGATLILSARNADKLAELAGELRCPTEVVPVDVADPASVAAAAEQIGHVDGMVFLAGVYWPMASQEWDTERATTMAEVNFSGALRCVGACLPQMIARDEGHIVLTGSLSGFRGLPGAIGYGASKAAVMHLAENLQADLRKTGVRVQLVNPGFIRTRLTDKNEFAMPFIMEPDAAADLFVRHMDSDGLQRISHDYSR